MIKINNENELNQYKQDHPLFLDNPIEEDACWDIIQKGSPKPKDLQCTWTNCKKPAFKYTSNLLGEFDHIYCKEHWTKIMKHLQFWS